MSLQTFIEHLALKTFVDEDAIQTIEELYRASKQGIYGGPCQFKTFSGTGSSHGTGGHLRHTV